MDHEQNNWHVHSDIMRFEGLKIKLEGQIEAEMKAHDKTVSEKL